jgi:thiamine biosynthesis protein ThiI
MPAARGTIIIRPGAELATKHARTRRRFFHALRQNIEEALTRRGIAFTLSNPFGRLFLETESVVEASDIMPRIFGVGSFSVVEFTCAADLESIAREGGQAFAARVRGKCYAVRAKCQGGLAPRPHAIQCELGAKLNPYGVVDLEQPDVTVHVEVLGECAYFFTQRTPGAGGMPSSVQGHALALISGGFDSAVAAWRIMKRGAKVDFVFFNLGGRAYERMVVQVTKLLTELWAYGHRPRLHIVDFNAVSDALRQNVKPQYWQVVLKRLMYRAAERVAEDVGADALITGEALGQVSSQTMANLAALDRAVAIPVLRPLIGFDKPEIIAEARRIGTAWLSEKVKEYCAMSAMHPVIATRKDRLDFHEAKVGVEVLCRALQARTSLDLLGLSSDELRSPYLFTSRVPEGAVLLDCQPEHMYQAWHARDAERHLPEQLVKGFKQLDKSRTYVLYCTYGIQTPFLAELLQQNGYEAYAFEGGIKALQRALGDESRELAVS